MPAKALTCADCRFWNEPSSGDLGQCRFNPPVVVFATQQGTQWAEYPDSVWPITNATEWCGKAEVAR